MSNVKHNCGKAEGLDRFEAARGLLRRQCRSAAKLRQFCHRVSSKRPRPSLSPHIDLVVKVVIMCEVCIHQKIDSPIAVDDDRVSFALLPNYDARKHFN